MTTGRIATALFNMFHAPSPYTLSPDRVKLITSQDYQVEFDKDEKEGDLVFQVLGCSGTGDENQMAVQALMSAAALKTKPLIRIHAGDLAYPNKGGFSSEEDAHLKLKEFFHDIYQDKIPTFGTPGNHEWGNQINDYTSIFHLINHTFMENGTPSQNRKQLFDNKILKLEDLKKLDSSLFIPRLSYSLMIDNRLLFVFLDSMTLLKDILDTLTHEENLEQKKEIVNQVTWFKKLIAAHSDKKIVVITHCPPISLAKRSIHSSDNGYCLNRAQLALLEMHDYKGSHHEMLHKFFSSLGQKLFLITAHEHGQKLYNSDNLCVIGAAGGGGQLESRQNFSERKKLHFISTKHGFFELRLTINNELLFGFYDADKKYYQFKYDQETDSIKNLNSASDDKFLLLRDVVFNACDAYYEVFRKANEHLWSKAWHLSKHGREGVLRAESFINLFLQVDPVITYEKAVEFIIHEMGDPRALDKLNHESLEYFINAALIEKMGLSYKELVNDYRKAKGPVGANPLESKEDSESEAEEELTPRSQNFFLVNSPSLPSCTSPMRPNSPSSPGGRGIINGISHLFSSPFRWFYKSPEHPATPISLDLDTPPSRRFTMSFSQKD